MVSTETMNGTMNVTEPPYGPDVDDCYLMKYYHKDLTQLLSVRATITSAYIAIAILAILGNILVIWTVWRNSHMHTVTNYYIVNLAISDLLVASLVMPLKLLEYTADCSWQVFTSNALCAVQYYLLPIFVFTSVLTLAATSIERFYAIVHPLSAMQINSKSRTRKIIASTWIIPIIVAGPYIYCKSMAFTIYSEYGSISRQICTDRFDDIDKMIHGEYSERVGEFRKVYFIFLFFAIYFIPSVVIFTTCVKIAISLLQPITVETTTFGRSDTSRRHEENKRKVARMVIVIAITFIVSWSPQFLVNIISQLQEESFLRKENYLFTMLIIHLCGFVNSCVNPIIYTAMSQKFRRSFKEVIRRVFFCCSMKSLLPYQSARESQRFTSTLRHTLSETDGNHIALNENNYFANRNRKSNSNSSSSGHGNDVRPYQCSSNDNKIIKKYIFKANGCSKTATEDLSKPLIAGNDSSPVREMTQKQKHSDGVNKKYITANGNVDSKVEPLISEDDKLLMTTYTDVCGKKLQNGSALKDHDTRNIRVRYHLVE